MSAIFQPLFAELFRSSGDSSRRMDFTYFFNGEIPHFPNFYFEIFLLVQFCYILTNIFMSIGTVISIVCFSIYCLIYLNLFLPLLNGDVLGE